MKITTLAAAAITCILASYVSSASAQDVTCYANKDYAIAAKSYSGEVGEQFAVMALAGKPKPAKCVFDAKKADYVIGKAGDLLSFGEQAGNLLILTRSTGPQGDLVVYDLKTRKSVLDVPSDDYALVAGKLTFWQRTVAATAKNCPSFSQNKKDGLGSVIAAQKVFDTATGTVKDLGKSRCDATQ